MAKHTPGPWGWGHSPATESQIGVHTMVAGPILSRWWSKTDKDYTERAEANARLIAAAPDLLACCEEIMEERGPVDTPFLERLAETLAKAKGE